MGWIKELGLFQTATCVVLSNDAPAIVKAVARVAKVALGGRIQICDGTDDNVEIQAALDALPATGGEVYLSEGNYSIAANLTIPGDTTLRGAGFGTIITTTDNMAITNVVIVNGDNVIIKDMKIVQGAGAGDAGGRPNIIYADTKTLVWLENLWLIGDETVGDDGSEERQNGICFVTVTESKVLNCRSEENRRNGIRLLDSDENTVTGNHLEGNTYYGIYLLKSSRNTIEANIIQNNNDAGIFMANLFATCHQNAIIGNVCRGNGGEGIFLTFSTEENTIAGNICEGNGEAGIRIESSDHNTVTGNNCNGNGENGIYIEAGSTKNTISGNNCAENTHHGIFLEAGADNNTVSSNNCVDNDSAGSTYSGICVELSDQNAVTGNHCSGNGLHGIYIYRSSYCSVVGNICSNQNTGNGIHIYGTVMTHARYNSLTGNTCYNNVNGIEIAGGEYVEKNIVVANQLTGNTGAALVDGGPNTEIGHNVTIA